MHRYNEISRIIEVNHNDGAQLRDSVRLIAKVYDDVTWADVSKALCNTLPGYIPIEEMEMQFSAARRHSNRRLVA
jgi:hypothetical protein